MSQAIQGGNLAGPGVALTAQAAQDLLQVLTTVTNNDDPFLEMKMARGSSSSATPVAVGAYTIKNASDCAGYIRYTMLARRTGGAGGVAGDYAVYEYRTAFSRIATVIALGGSPIKDVLHESQAGWDCGAQITGGTIEPTFTGAANNNVIIQIIEFYASEFQT